MRARPYRAAPDTPKIDDVADQIDRLCVMTSEKFEQRVGLTRTRRKMHIGQKECPRSTTQSADLARP
jgi:hypothetical protein